MPVSVPRLTRSTAPIDRPYTRPGRILGSAELLSPALVRHSSWPEIVTRQTKNWQVELAEQHSGRMTEDNHIPESHLAVSRNSAGYAMVNHRSQTVDPRQWCHDGDADEEMLSDDGSYIDAYQEDGQSQWTASSPISDTEMEQGEWRDSDSGFHDGHSYERGAFTPVFEDDSPVLVRDHDASSSPVGPITPFGEFVDRAVAVSEPYGEYENTHLVNDPVNYEHDRREDRYQPIEERLSPDVPEAVAPPSATAEYKKMAAPMSEFIAQYVWKACTTGMSLPAVYGRVPNSPGLDEHSRKPPSYLAPAVYSMLLSTLLQPSAIVLAIWYIVRLPVCFEATSLGPEHIRELNFRAELFGDGSEELQATAPFRLVILGCMLSNKWLDDHTFSNRTWQSISNLPIESLNTLESLALDIFSYDLSTPTNQWTQWLNHLLAYHQTCMSPVRIQPISRPSSNPQSIVRKTLDEVWAATRNVPVDIPQPVFIGLEQRKLDNVEAQQKKAKVAERLDIDLDEDGPIREEYLPRRRSSGNSAQGQPSERIHVTPAVNESVTRWARLAHSAESKSHLPPPAKWSPAADEPINRRSSGQYVAVQPPFCAPVAPGVPQWYQEWVTQGAYFTPAKLAYPAYTYEAPLLYAPYAHALVVHSGHARSQSMARDYEACQPTAHHRSYSQAGLGYRCSNLRMTSNENVPTNADRGSWVADQYAGSHRLPFGAAPHINYQPSWLRA